MTLRKNALVSLLVVMFLFTAFVPLAPAQTADNSNLEQQLVNQINQVRSQKNLSSLQQDYTLTAAAQEQAREIANTYSYNYSKLYQLMNDGKYQTVRMQILRSSNVVELAKNQMNNANSPALQGQYNVIGVGIADNKYYGKVAVQIFAQAKNVSQQPKPEQPKQEQPQPEQPQASPTPEPKPQPKPETNNTTAGNTQLSAFQNQVAQLVNQERAKAGLQPLVVKMDLTKVAQIKAEDMATNKYFSHTSPTYGSPFDMMKKFGINYTRAGENIAMGYTTPESVMEGWMNSPGHKANILNPNFKEIGIGYAANGNYWVQMFATR